MCVAAGDRFAVNISGMYASALVWRIGFEDTAVELRLMKGDGDRERGV